MQEALAHKTACTSRPVPNTKWSASQLHSISQRALLCLLSPFRQIYAIPCLENDGMVGVGNQGAHLRG